MTTDTCDGGTFSNFRRPAFGKRVLVKFDGTFYPGTINSDGESARDRKHSRGRWSVLFDDCTRDRFKDNANDGEYLFVKRGVVVTCVV